MGCVSHGPVFASYLDVLAAVGIVHTGAHSLSLPICESFLWGLWYRRHMQSF